MRLENELSIFTTYFLFLTLIYYFSFQKDDITTCFWLLHLHQMSWTEEVFRSSWKLLEAFGKWRENLNWNLELKLILVKFELNLKVFEVFLKIYLGFLGVSYIAILRENWCTHSHVCYLYCTKRKGVELDLAIYARM